MEEISFVKLFYENLKVHLSQSLDINPGKFDIEQGSDEIYPNKNRMMGLNFCVMTRNWSIFNYVWS
jgi:hypothetical protein